MTWADFWARTILQSALSSVVSVLVGLYIKRLIRQNKNEVEQVIATVEAIIGTTLNIHTTQEKRMLPDPAVYRKAIAAGLGFIITGTATWAVTAPSFAPLLEPYVPELLRPLIVVLLGGIATTAAVIRAKNAPAAGTIEADSPAVVPAGSFTLPASVTAAAVTTGTAPTSIVHLLPAPELSYL